MAKGRKGGIHRQELRVEKGKEDEFCGVGVGVLVICAVGIRGKAGEDVVVEAMGVWTVGDRERNDVGVVEWFAGDGVVEKDREDEPSRRMLGIGEFTVRERFWKELERLDRRWKRCGLSREVA